MFIYAFERVLRQAAISAFPNSTVAKNLTLPYWDIQANPTLPPAFRNPTYNLNGVPTPNPLYTPNRAALFTSGEAEISTSIRNQAARVLTFTTDTNNNGRIFDEFAKALEGNPHGAVHCAVSVNSTCANGLMGKLATAGNDPLFWIHHSNIDRIYDCWLRQRGGRAPTLADGVDPAESFDFISPDGKKISWTVASMPQRLSNAGVSYVQPASCTGTTTAVSTTLAVASAGSAPSSDLDENEMKEIANSKGTTVTGPSKEASTKKKLKLLLKGVQPDALGRMFNVYLVNKKGKAFLVGTIEFFSSDHPHHRGGKVDFEFDATDSFAASGEPPGGKLKVVLRPTSGLEFTDSKKSVPLVTQSPGTNARSSEAATAAVVPEAADLKVESLVFE